MTTVLEAGELILGYVLRRGRERRVSDELALTLEGGQLTCLLGPNGAGKSTLLRTLAGMQKPLAGWVRILGQPLEHLSPPALARRVSVVLTGSMALGNLTARTLVSLGRYPYTDWMGRLSPDDWDRVDGSLAALSATDLSERRVAELSDGERQKVLIARALAQEPRLMILDEPTSFLDLPRRIEMLALLRRLTRTTGCSVVLATHHLDLALHYADRLWLQPMSGAFQSGLPEDLALTGALERTFMGPKDSGKRQAGVDLRYDRERGEFRFTTNEGGRRVELSGDGLGRVWAGRALRREGFEVVEGGDGSDAVVRVQAVGAEDAWQWSWSVGERRGRAGSLAELMSSLSADEES